MRSWLLAGAVLWVAACGQEGNVGEADGLPPFDPSAVVFADGCAPMPEAQNCIEQNPVQFLPGDAPVVAQRCEDFGYTCCDPDLWISPAAASCIAEQDPRMSDLLENRVTFGCYEDVFGPMYEVYELDQQGTLKGIGVHAATGRITWFDDGSGVFS